MISIKHQFLFLHLPKTGGNSLQSVLQHYSEDELVVRHAHQDGVERFSVRNDRIGIAKHVTLQQYVDAYGPELIHGLHKFAVIRNPWDRAMSYYFSPSSQRQEFRRTEFVEVLNEMPTLRQYVCLRGDGQSTPLDANLDDLLLFERLEEDVSRLGRILKLPDISLPHRNASNKPHYSIYYDDDLVQLVHQKFEEEVDFAGYRFERRRS